MQKNLVSGIQRRGISLRKTWSLLEWILLLGMIAWPLSSSLAYTPMTPPAWAGDAHVVRHLYFFPTNSTTPLPDQGSHPFGVPTANVVLGPYAAGWQDPDNPFSSYGEPGSGAWDLGKGPDGKIRLAIPVGNAASGVAFGSYSVQIKVNVVGYTMLVALPSLSAEGYSLDPVSMTDSHAYNDPSVGTWRNRTWTAEVEGVTGDTLTLVISASPTGSCVDTIEVYARATVIPAPASAKGTPLPWFAHFQISPANGETWDDADFYDNDGDGMLNWEEYLAGTDPTDDQSILKIVRLQVAPGGHPYLEWIGGTKGPSTPYVVECTEALINPNWQEVGQSARLDGLNSWQGTMALSQVPRYFRVRAGPVIP